MLNSFTLPQRHQNFPAKQAGRAEGASCTLHTHTVPVHDPWHYAMFQILIGTPCASEQKDRFAHILFSFNMRSFHDLEPMSTPSLHQASGRCMHIIIASVIACCLLQAGMHYNRALGHLPGFYWSLWPACLQESLTVLITPTSTDELIAGAKVAKSTMCTQWVWPEVLWLVWQGMHVLGALCIYALCIVMHWPMWFVRQLKPRMHHPHPGLCNISSHTCKLVIWLCRT